MSAKSRPQDYRTVTPLIAVKGAARLIDFLKTAFGAEEVYRFSAKDGSVAHAELRIGDSVLMLGEAHEGFSAMPVSLYVYVQDPDSVYQAALDAGGESVDKPADEFWGDRVATVRDFAGNRWWIATRVEEVSSDEISRRARAKAA